ncbi:hypothetical protein [Methylobacterium marchantiae]|uniref:Uncharacterized protein n=1 Tax=Methylobacterium marchantiae TaxID=600331 RepID=A0ABW3X2R0_9HYPH|nr:hypothetical protein AIGOOFII_3475 [Methylobacterium marchantiae]
MLAAYARHYWRAGTGFIQAHPLALVAIVAFLFLLHQVEGLERHLNEACTPTMRLPDATIMRFGTTNQSAITAMRKACTGTPW